MNIFVLNSGRCGSTAFIRACQHITNYSAAHESRVNLIGEQRLAYPENHIEADNRLCWFLGRLDQKYGDRGFYVHLTRDLDKTADSFVKREHLDNGIMKAYKEGVLLGGKEDQSTHDIALDYLDTVDNNITHFLKDKTNKMDFSLESAKADFNIFWKKTGAEGDLENALKEWDVIHNASVPGLGV